MEQPHNPESLIHENVVAPYTIEVTDIDHNASNEPIAPTEMDALCTHSFKELRKLCRLEKLSQSGTKQEMVERLRKSASKNNIII